MNTPQNSVKMQEEKLLFSTIIQKAQNKFKKEFEARHKKTLEDLKKIIIETSPNLKSFEELAAEASMKYLSSVISPAPFVNSTSSIEQQVEDKIDHTIILKKLKEKFESRKREMPTIISIGVAENSIHTTNRDNTHLLTQKGVGTLYADSAVEKPVQPAPESEYSPHHQNRSF